LKTITLNFNEQHDIRSVMVTSPTPGVGKTVTAINLGVQIARHTNRTALLLDLNFRRPAIHRYFGHRPRMGIADCLQEGIAFRDILFTPVDRLVVAPSGEGDATELISSPLLAELIDETVSRYKERLIILDMPSVLECDDVVALAPKVDANLLVLEAGKSRHHEVEETLGCLSGTRTLGVVLNRVGAGA
jgi:Mrp family chromosome partitioning ATPase